MCNEERQKKFRCKFCSLIYGNDGDDPDNIETDFNEEKLLVHEYICPEQFITCKFCDRKYTLREMKNHLSENRCTIAQLENKIEFLNQKVKFYEREIEKGIDIDMKKLPLERTKSDLSFKHRSIRITNGSFNLDKILEDTSFDNGDALKNKLKATSDSRIMKSSTMKTYTNNTKTSIGQYTNKNNGYINTSLNSSLNKTAITIKNNNKNNYGTNLSKLNFSINSEYDSEKECMSNRSKHEYKVGGEIEYSIPEDSKSSLKKMELVDKHIYTHQSSVSALLLNTDDENKPTDILISLSDFNIQKDLVDYDNNTVNEKEKVYLEDVAKKSAKITSVLTLPNGDLFLTTEKSFYYLYNSSFQLIKSGRPASTAITCSLSLPYNHSLIALGTLSSNLLIINPYLNQTIEVIPHTKKKILSMSFVKGMLVSSSIKENAFYFWEPPKSENDKFKLKATIKEHSGWVWSTYTATIMDEDYLLTGGGDKRIFLWKIYPAEKSVKKCLTIKEHTDSVTCLKCICVNKEKDKYVIISGSYDGVIKLNSIDRAEGYEVFSTRCLLSIFNKDDIVKGIAAYMGKEDSLVVIVNCEGYEGYIINEIKCLYW